MDIRSNTKCLYILSFSTSSTMFYSQQTFQSMITGKKKLQLKMEEISEPDVAQILELLDKNLKWL